MAQPTLTVGGNNQLSFLLAGSLTVKFNTVDFVLNNPTNMPALGDTVTLTNPSWTGTVKDVTSEDLTEKKGPKYLVVKVTATNTDTGSASAAPFNLSDTPNNTTTFGYRDLVIQKTTNTDGTTTTNGSCTIYRDGLWPLMTFTLTSANQGYAGTSFTVRNVTARWLRPDTAEYQVEFGDPIVTMEVWMNDSAASEILPITETKIDTSAVTTPKIAANAITAEKILAGEITAEKLAATLVLASIIKTAGSGTRVEISTDGVYLYDSSDQIVVKIPTNSDPVYISGQLNASSLVSTTSAQFRNEATLTMGSTFTAEANVVKPTSAPVLVAGYETIASSVSSGTDWGFTYDGTHMCVAGDNGSFVQIWKYTTAGAYNSTITTDVPFSVASDLVSGLAWDSTNSLFWVLRVRSGVVTLYKLNSSGVTQAGYTITGDVSGTKTQAGLFYDATANQVVVVTTTGTGASVQLRFRRYTPSSGALASTLDGTGLAVDGTTTGFTGGARVGSDYWVSTYPGSVAVSSWNQSTGAAGSNVAWGYNTSGTNIVNQGITHDGTVFWFLSNRTMYKTTNWTWTTESAKYWVGYSWYDSAGTTHETEVGPRTSITMYRRMRLQVTNATIPVAGADDPDSVRIYMERNATEPSAGSYKRQVTDALTTRYLTTFATGGAADPTSNDFPGGSAASITSGSTGWTLKGNGLIAFGGTSFPGSPSSGDQYFRTDHDMWFFYDGTRWLSTQLFQQEITPSQMDSGLSATDTYLGYRSVPRGVGTDVWIEDVVCRFKVVSGGSALSGSHSWVGTLSKERGTDLAQVTVATITINSGSSGVWRNSTVAVDALLDSEAHYAFAVGFTKTGSPGNIFPVIYVTYRYVAT